MSNLTNIDIFQLLALDSLSQEEKNQYLLRISKIGIQQAIEKAIKDGLLNVDEVEKASQEIQDSNQLQVKLLEMCPTLGEYVQNAIDNMKIEILQKQVDETLQKSVTEQSEDMTPAIDLESYLNHSIEELEESVLMEKVNSFRKLQDNMLTSKNGQ